MALIPRISDAEPQALLRRGRLDIWWILLLLTACGIGVQQPPSGGSAGSSGSAGTLGSGGAAGSPTDGLEPGPDCVHPVVVADCTQRICRIPAGCFVMGAPPTEWFQAAVSTPQTRVTLTRAFELARTEVTRTDWESAGFAPVREAPNSDGFEECLEATCPMVNVSFWDGLAFLNRLSEQAGLPSCYDLTACSGEVGHGFSCESVRTTTYPIYTCAGYRLPTEAEWEYASRAGTRTAFNLGNVVPVEDCEHKQPALEPMAWYCGNSERRAHDVAQKQPNGWGLYDMAGNVQEWCNDLYATYPKGPLVDPVGRLTTNADITGGSDRPRILRGGDFGTLVPLLKNSWHNYASDRGYGINVGLRFARTLP